MSSFVVEIRRRDPALEPPSLELVRAAGASVAGLREAWVYELGPLSEDEARRLAEGLLADPALDEARVLPAGAPDEEGCAEDEAVLTLLRRDGVMDPVALSTREAAAQLGIELSEVRTAHRLYLRGAEGKPPRETVAALAQRLANPVVDRALVEESR
ncbi:MAG TPA: hypothetical protein DEA08_11815, partial [Planctomycetes bacterium]|nr:hypothetical protein [Planctomycetota bacterium]